MPGLKPGQEALRSATRRIVQPSAWKRSYSQEARCCARARCSAVRTLRTVVVVKQLCLRGHLLGALAWAAGWYASR
jgi:hypothetical protein